MSYGDKFIASTKNKLCIFFPSRLCWQIMELTLGADKPCDEPCINHLAYQDYMEKGLTIPEVPPIQVIVRKLGD